MWAKIEKTTSERTCYFKPEAVENVVIFFDEYAKDHDIPTCWTLRAYFRSGCFESKDFVTKEEAEKWARENIFNACTVPNSVPTVPCSVPNLQETLLDLDLGLKYGTYSDNDKLSIIDSAMIVLQRHRAALTSKERGW